MRPLLVSLTGLVRDRRKIDRLGARLNASRSPVGRQVPRLFSLENPEIVERNVAERLFGHAEVLGQHVGRRMRDPVGQEQRVAFGLLAAVEGEDELAAVGAEALQRVRPAGREIPEITLFDVIDAGTALCVDGGDAAFPARHDRPLGGLVPVQLADAAGRQVHVDAGDLLGNREVLGRQLARPSSILDPFGRDVERGPEEGLGADIGGGRIHLRGELALDRLVVRAVAAQAFRVALGVYPTLGRQVGIAECWRRMVRNRSGCIPLTGGLGWHWFLSFEGADFVSKPRRVSAAQTTFVAKSFHPTLVDRDDSSVGAGKPWCYRQ